MSQFNVLNRYLFTDAHARGELVQLSSSFESIIKNHNYPVGVEKLLGELLCATCLLTATLKFEGDITVQLQGDGPVGYMSVSGNNKQQMRGIAKMAEETSADTLQTLIGKGTMIITIRPNAGEAYQGVVALDEESLADCLAHYFDVSEQIPTKIWLFCDTEQQLAAGALVQLLPDGDGSTENKEQQQSDFEHLCQLTNTIKSEEVFSLEAEALLYRLYHQEQVNIFEPQMVSYLCGCSADKCLSAISQIEPSEIKAILAEHGKISMTCDYCITTYDFDELSLKSFISKVNH
ncbi:Hsp33 family molecular chaperone HslO [Colwellia psychrerythraea]|uniref:33 kDa chaperonin n=1 Tax=Colwellia psychrerythraea (strain 34H / ATCC BAA-681) TaxID=167879 RepID=HSLO_COLP3|nr:Hsp33 family molecular chaperone HslO [Colwellia psychrerythraea]Q47VD1.1 RecName: Full=33 kDa chaperonin; AltName: Full=Heat shock protein 33 homolog; Short=HSP33 [Colwellia psychrerythraea 34H]AAZ26994.1 chaperone protein HslO [Colwellia psychrerythraea 34H]